LNNPIRLIDNAGSSDVRGEEYDKKITKDIQNLFNTEIETLHAICLVIKITVTRIYDKAKQIDKIFSVFRDEIKKNTIFYRIPPPKYGGMAIQMG
jgi:hypothetical protein